MNTKPLVFLDIDDTILDFLKAEDIALRKCLHDMGIEADDAMVKLYSGINVKYWEMLERNEITKAQTLTGRFDELLRIIGRSDISGEKCQEVYESYLKIGHFFMPGAEKLLDNLYGKYRLFLVSNGVYTNQTSRLESAGIEHYFEGIFISEKVGAEKPNKEFFDIAFGTIDDFSLEDSVIIGDSLTSDIKGGKNVGIKTVWYNYRHKAEREDIIPDYILYSLDDIPALLESIFD